MATKSNFEEMLALAPMILHISCHGIDNTQQTMRANYEEVKEEGNFLLFETFEGAGELVSAKQLRQLVERSGQTLNVIVVAACKSEFIGEILLKCGAKHVICIKKGESVLDTAAINFTKSFYSNIFSGKKVCQAFERARNSVEFHECKGEANIFKLFIQEQVG